MKPEDQEALEAAIKKSGYIGFKTLRPFEKGFIAACDHRDAQPAVAQEPVGYQFRTRPVHHRGKGWGSWEPCDKQLFDACIKIPVNNDLEFEVRKIYTEAPAAVINERVTKYNLPPLPKPAEPSNGGQCCGNFTSGGEYLGQSETICCGQFEEVLPDYYTAAQMWAYARAAIAAAEAEKAKGGAA